jgi:hypothetical protein
MVATCAHLLAAPEWTLVDPVGGTRRGRGRAARHEWHETWERATRGAGAGLSVLSGKEGHREGIIIETIMKEACLCYKLRQ